MASLVENLVETLEGENSEYQMLLELSRSKTQIIVNADLEKLQKVTDDEQIIVDRINNLERRRIQIMNDVAKILNTDVEGLKLETLISLLDKAPKDQKNLSLVHDKLKATLREMKLLNERNESLLNSAIEMVEFDLSLIQAMKTAPETANYNKGAYNTGSVLMSSSGSFDAKQ
ncbi:MAG: flagellar protein FlgN [Lachnospiraceae bacterium]|nr:flagellar protein FlgN [Lachnospiraceae bacterium]